MSSLTRQDGGLQLPRNAPNAFPRGKPAANNPPRASRINWKTIILAGIGVILLVLACLVWYEGFHDRGMRKLNPQRLAAAETRMWKLYYGGGSDFALGKELIALLRDQFGLSYATAIKVGRDLAAATVKFRGTKTNYEEIVLPDLERAYTRVCKAVNGTWDPKEVARAELKWWVARRSPETHEPEQVGRDIAHQYALLYGKENPEIDRAGLLRAQAADLRDKTARNTDWNKIGHMLEESYRALARGVEIQGQTTQFPFDTALSRHERVN
jgi:hypothetical protein